MCASATEESGPLVNNAPLTGYEPNFFDDYHFSETADIFIQESSSDSRPSNLHDLEIEDYTIGRALYSPLFTEEREDPAGRRQVYHSPDESLLSSQSLSVGHVRTRRPVSDEFGSLIFQTSEKIHVATQKVSRDPQFFSLGTISDLSLCNIRSRLRCSYLVPASFTAQILKRIFCDRFAWICSSAGLGPVPWKSSRCTSMNTSSSSASHVTLVVLVHVEVRVGQVCHECMVLLLRLNLKMMRLKTSYIVSLPWNSLAMNSALIPPFLRSNSQRFVTRSFPRATKISYTPISASRSSSVWLSLPRRPQLHQQEVQQFSDICVAAEVLCGDLILSSSYRDSNTRRTLNGHLRAFASRKLCPKRHVQCRGFGCSLVRRSQPELSFRSHRRPHNRCGHYRNFRPHHFLLLTSGIGLNLSLSIRVLRSSTRSLC